MTIYSDNVNIQGIGHIVVLVLSNTEITSEL